MKIRHFIFYIIIILLFSHLSYGTNDFTSKHDSTFYKNYFKIVPWGIIIGSYTIDYERKIKKRNSIDFFGSYRYNTNNYVPILNWYSNDIDTKWEVKGFMYSIGYRHYFSSLKPDGFYISPFHRFCFLNETKRDTYDNTLICRNKIYSAGVGLLIGYQLLSKRFILDLFIGPQVKYKDGITSSQINIPWENWNATFFPSIRIGINIGFAL